MQKHEPDTRFKVEVVSQTPNPQQVIYAAMHQDYSEEFVWDERDRFPSESKAGEIAVKRLLSGERGHFGCLESPQITLNCGWFPHSVMQQLRTHRVGVSFDVQCLAGHTEITFLRDSLWTETLFLTELYDLWIQDESKVKAMSIRVLNENSGLFESSRIQSVISSGVQPVYRLRLSNGKNLDCTANHRLLTTEGWMTMGEALGLNHKGSELTLSRFCYLICDHGGKAESFLVTNITFLGHMETYDLEIAGDWHNFVANSAVVHNSMRYTGQRLIDVANGDRDIEDVFYLRPLGFYSDRQGKKYEYTAEQRQEDLEWCLAACDRYKTRFEQGFAEEHARGTIPFDFRQHFIFSANARSLMHVLDLRAKADAQLEIQQLCELIWPHFEAWVPAIAHWYKVNRWGKARLAP